MEDFSLSNKLLPLLLAVALVAVGVWAFSEKQTSSATIHALQQEVTERKEQLETAESDLERLSQQVEALYTEKNGTANDTLQDTTNRLFSMVYTYDSTKEEDSVKARKSQAGEVANQQALNGLFPKDADQVVASVATVSRLEKDPEVYLMASNDKEMTALVVVHYSLSIAGSSEQSGTFMYKVTFDPTAKQFTDIKNVGEVHVP